MLTIPLVSDNHGETSVIRKILNDNVDSDYYLHCGDSCLDEKSIKPFSSVKGNNDYFYQYPSKKIIELKGNKILITHGTYYTYSLNMLAEYAKEEGCNVVFYGHTHIYFDDYVNGVRLINPGSCYHNRDGSRPCYARINIDDNGKIHSTRVDL